MLKLAAVAGFSAIVGLFAGTSSAATVLNNGDAVGGWNITAAPGVAVVVDSSTSTTVTLEKTAAFSNANEGLIITFTQVSADAASTIDINNEMITNTSGTTFSGFQFLLLNPNGAASFVNDPTVPSPFAPAAGFTLVSVSSDSISYSGSQANMATSSWGFDTADTKGGDLIINANPMGVGTTFDLKEIPEIPLPPAVWQGLVGIMGLGLVSYGKSLKRLMA